MGVHSLIQFDMLSDMKAFDVSAWTGSSLMSSALVVDMTTLGDSKGGLYRWDPTSSATEETTYYNVIASTTTATGRWLRVFQRVRILPQGILVFNGNVKTLYVTGTTNSSGECQFYMTYDGTSTGAPIFTQVLTNDSEALVDSTAPANAITSYVKTQPTSTSYISTTHGYYKANVVTITLSLVYNPLSSIGAGTAVTAVIIGL